MIDEAFWKLNIRMLAYDPKVKKIPTKSTFIMGEILVGVKNLEGKYDETIRRVPTTPRIKRMAF